jgi:DNA-binding transcriptional LysR family regulator
VEREVRCEVGVDGVRVRAADLQLTRTDQTADELLAVVVSGNLRVVQQVAAMGSFTAAARTLGYTQSAISRQVAAAETAVGLDLFEREARGITPTPAGEVLARHAGTILAAVAAGERESADLGDRLAGRLAVGAFPSAAAVLVPRALAQIAAEHPGLELAFREASTPVLLRDLRAGGLDVAVIGVGDGPPDYDLDGLRRHPLVSNDLRIAVPTGHRLADRDDVVVTDLADEARIVGTGPRGDPQFGAWPTLSEPRVAHAVRGWPARLGLVAAGVGIALLPGLAAASVPAGVRVLRVNDPRWPGRHRRHRADAFGGRSGDGCHARSPGERAHGTCRADAGPVQDRPSSPTEASLPGGYGRRGLQRL